MRRGKIRERRLIESIVVESESTGMECKSICRVRPVRPSRLFGRFILITIRTTHLGVACAMSTSSCGNQLGAETQERFLPLERTPINFAAVRSANADRAAESATASCAKEDDSSGWLIPTGTWAPGDTLDSLAG